MRRGSNAVASAAGATPAGAQETIATIMGDALPPMIQQPLGLTLSQTFLYSAAFAVGLVVLVGTRPALVVLHNAWDHVGRRVKHKLLTDSFGWSAKTAPRCPWWRWRGPTSSSCRCIHRRSLTLPARKVRQDASHPVPGHATDSFRKRYLARLAGAMRRRIYGKMEPSD